MSPAAANYVVITPVRDEALYVEETIRSMVAQKLRPVEWVVVDDGSTDGTGDILDRHAEDHEWLSVVHCDDRGFRAAGSGVMEAFHAGLDALCTDDWDFIVKLDGDLSFDADYFEKCLGKFDEEPRLGIGGGVISNMVDGKLELEHHPVFHVRGATKIYRRACWEEIDGLYKIPGWDTLDEVKANMHDWTTRSFPDLHLVQHRATGEAAGQWSNWVKNGRASYIAGYHPLFLLAKAMRRVVRRPYVVASLGVVWGFLGAFIARVPRIGDRRLISYLRRQQMRRLFGLQSIWQ